MYALLDRRSRRRISEPRFAAELQHVAAIATASSLRLLRVGSRSGDAIPVRMLVRTRLFGALPETLIVPLSGDGADVRIHLAAEVMFPGLRAHETLTRSVSLPPRAALLAGDGTPLAEGPDRTSPIPAVASEIVGRLGPIPAPEKAGYVALGYPEDAHVGLDGLERIFQAQLAGKPGGVLRAGRRMLAAIAPAPGHTVRTTIDPRLEQAAITALAGRYAGIAVMDPRTGGLLALAGVAFSAVQPPGSTMKIVTATAALDAGIVTLGTTFPDAGSATIDGYTLQNAGGEVCGGTLLNAFAVSCNSVFAPLGVKIGAVRLVAMAQRFGFDQPSPIAGAAESTIPSAGTIGSALAVGSSAIGQGLVQASALQMTDVAATIADHGRRPLPTLEAGAPPRFVRVTSARVAGEVQQMMLAVVRFGTGQSAQIPGVEVAGKTGTAELRTTQGSSVANDPNANAAANTDAWFVGYAPAGRPQVVVGALFPNQGAGGDTAAPAVRQVLEAALQGA
jgi:cell division protein FtsI/penicillin-binding protein 2